MTASGPRTVLAGAPATFTAAANDPDPGDAVLLTWQFDGGASAIGAHVTHAFATAGPHTATVTATDLEGLFEQAVVLVVVSARAVRPAITGMRITPANLLAASSGPAARGCLAPR